MMKVSGMKLNIVCYLSIPIATPQIADVCQLMIDSPQMCQGQFVNTCYSNSSSPILIVLRLESVLGLRVAVF